MDSVSLIFLFSLFFNLCCNLYYFFSFSFEISLFFFLVLWDVNFFADLKSFIFSYMKVFIIIKLHPSTPFTASHKLFYVCLYFICYKGIFSFLCVSLSLWLFMSVEFNFHVFVDFPVFLLLLISDFILVW